MTFKTWLSIHDITWSRQPRGFNIENGLGQARYVQLIEGRVMRFIDEDDVRQWVKKNLQDDFFTDDERKSFKHVVA